jgi:hypothetical protein
MFRLVGTSVFLGVVLAALALAATAATVPPDEAAYQASRAQAAVAQEPLDAAMVVWAQGQPAGTGAMTDAHQRAAQPTTRVVTDASDRMERPVVVVADTADGIGWTTTAVWALIGAAVVIGVVALAIVLLGTPRGHPPLAHH